MNWQPFIIFLNVTYFALFCYRKQLTSGNVPFYFLLLIPSCSVWSYSSNFWRSANTSLLNLVLQIRIQAWNKARRRFTVILTRLIKSGKWIILMQNFDVWCWMLTVFVLKLQYFCVEILKLIKNNSKKCTWRCWKTLRELRSRCKYQIVYLTCSCSPISFSLSHSWKCIQWIYRVL